MCIMIGYQSYERSFSRRESQMDEKQLNFFKTVLLREKTRIEHNLQASIMDLQNNAEQPRGDQIDEAVSLNQTSMSLRMKEREKKLLAKVNLALARIREGTFGECEDCGEEIGNKRLKARPVTTFCIVCKEKQERHEGSFITQ
jgi:DnaK suppressor protein